MPKKKRILAITHSPIAVHPRYETTWADIWIRLWMRNKRVYLGPTLCGLLDLEGKIEIAAKMLDEYGEKHAASLRGLREMHAALVAGAPALVDPADRDSGMPTVYVAEPRFNRKQAATALEFLLRDLGHVAAGAPIRFSWKKPELFVLSA